MTPVNSRWTLAAEQFSYPHISLRPPWHLATCLLPWFMWCYETMLAYIHGDNSDHVSGSDEHRLLFTFQTSGSLKRLWQRTPLYAVSCLTPNSNISLWQSTVGSPQKSPNKVFLHKHHFFLALLSHHNSAPSLASPHFSKSARSIKTKPNKEL